LLPIRITPYDGIPGRREHYKSNRILPYNGIISNRILPYDGINLPDINSLCLRFEHHVALNYIESRAEFLHIGQGLVATIEINIKIKIKMGMKTENMKKTNNNDFESQKRSEEESKQMHR
jgi:hypothetical protein